MAKSILHRLKEFKPYLIERWTGNDGEDRIANIEEAKIIISEILKEFDLMPIRVDFANAEDYAEAIDKWWNDLSS